MIICQASIRLIDMHIILERLHYEIFKFHPNFNLRHHKFGALKFTVITRLTISSIYVNWKSYFYFRAALNTNKTNV